MERDPVSPSDSADDALEGMPEGNRRFAQGGLWSFRPPAIMRAKSIRGFQMFFNNIAPALPEFDAALSPKEQWTRAVESNARWTVRKILAKPVAPARLEERALRIAGADHEFESGQVRLLPMPKDRS